MKWDDESHLSPCAKCPYREDAPKELWSPLEFIQLLKNDRDEMNGKPYGCHNDGKAPKEKVRPCVGWLLDQKRRGTPSIQLRLALAFSAAARECYERIHSNGLKLYKSIEAMCRANGVPVSDPPKKKGL